jgi:hypothetical protein
MKRWILKIFFKRELENLFWAFKNVENQILKAHLHKPRKVAVERAISNWINCYIDICK